MAGDRICKGLLKHDNIDVCYIKVSFKKVKKFHGCFLMRMMMRMIDDDKNLDGWKSRSTSKGKQNWAEGWKAPIRQSRDFLGILTFSKICETGGTWMVCLPSWMRWGLARPVGGILIITTALVTHIKTLFHLKIFELLFFLWETSKGYTGWHFKKTNLGCFALRWCRRYLNSL